MENFLRLMAMLKVLVLFYSRWFVRASSLECYPRRLEAEREELYLSHRCRGTSGSIMPPVPFWRLRSVGERCSPWRGFVMHVQVSVYLHALRPAETRHKAAQAPKGPLRAAKPNPPRPLLSGPRGCLIGSPSFGVDGISRRGPSLLPISSGSKT